MSITRRELFTSIIGIAGCAVVPHAIAKALTNRSDRPYAVGAILWDMPYLDKSEDAVGYRPSLALRGAEAMASLDEAQYRSHHLYA